MKHKDEQKFRATHSFVKDKFNKLEGSNNSKISEDNWTRAEGGVGTTYVIADGDFFDNCAVNFSSIYGKKTAKCCTCKNS